jgi:5-methylcytosine-specific restriction endonuclease McrA
MTTRDPRTNSRAYRNLCRAILDRDRHACQIRGARCTLVATEVDHIVAKADGGALFDPANLRAACKACNSGRSAERTNAKRWQYRTTEPAYETRL